jgi:hypothetical protein
MLRRRSFLQIMMIVWLRMSLSFAHTGCCLMRMLELFRFLKASMEDCFASHIVDLDWIHQMWTFLQDHYEPTRQSTYLAAIHQEQLL